MQSDGPNFSLEALFMLFNVGATDRGATAGGQPSLPALHPQPQGGHLVRRTHCQGQSYTETDGE